MTQGKRHRATGIISGVQEQRFQLITDEGTGLFTDAGV